MLNRLRELRLIRKLKVVEVASALGVAPTTLTGWEHNKREMDYTALKKASQFFDVSIDYIIGNDFDLKGLSEEEREIISEYRNLSLRERNIFTEILHILRRLK